MTDNIRELDCPSSHVFPVNCNITTMVLPGDGKALADFMKGDVKTLMFRKTGGGK